MKEKLLFGLKWFYKSFIWLFIVLLGIDILTKQLIMHSGMTPNASEYLDWGIVHIGYVLNYNAAFGIGTDNHTLSRVLYLVVASIASIGVTVYLILKRKTMKLYIRACLVLVITGAIGNMVDRIFYGPEYAVVDWIDFYWFWGFNFNIADCCVVIAAFMLLIYIIVEEVKEAKKKPKVKVVQEKQLSKTEKELLEAKQKEDKTENEEDK